jgi:hypothetical protein
MLAEKYILLLETLRRNLPDQSPVYSDGSPRVASSCPHIQVKLPSERGK